MPNQKPHLHRSTPHLFHLLLSLLLMSLSSLISSAAASAGNHRRKPQKKHQPTLSWDHLRTLLNCKTSAASNQVHDPSSATSAAAGAAGAAAGVAGAAAGVAGEGKKLNLGVRVGASICALGDVIHGSTRVVHRCDTDQYNSSGGCGAQSRSYIAGETESLTWRRRKPAAAAAPARGGVQLMRLSGCYECRAVEAEPASRYPNPRPRTLCACPQCGEVFNKADSLELHQTIRHAVSELAPDDSGRHIVELIFKSSWQNHHRPICKILRILKVHNTPRTISRFEDYRASVKSLAGAAASGRRNPRCAADGNELLRFHAASLSCRLGAAASTSLCSAAAGAAACGVCDVIRHGFRRPRHPLGVRTTASSGQAHEDLACGGGEAERAMLVCRVIAGRVGCDGGEGLDGCDSVAAEGANHEELFVGNPRGILPCFVVVYGVHY